MQQAGKQAGKQQASKQQKHARRIESLSLTRRVATPNRQQKDSATVHAAGSNSSSSSGSCWPRQISPTPLRHTFPFPSLPSLHTPPSSPPPTILGHPPLSSQARQLRSPYLCAFFPLPGHPPPWSPFGLPLRFQSWTQAFLAWLRAMAQPGFNVGHQRHRPSVI